VLHNLNEAFPWTHYDGQLQLKWAKGLAYLHCQAIVHWHLKSLNVLLDDNYHAKITDFMMAKLKITSMCTHSKQCPFMGTTRLCVPEKV